MEWKKVKISDIAYIINGGTPKTSIPEYWDGDIPWLSVKDFNTGLKYVSSAEKHITQEGLEHSATNLLEPEDIIISARGTIGVIAMLSRPMAFNQSCFGLRARNFDAHYLYYLLKEKVKELQGQSQGSVFDTIVRATFDRIECVIPATMDDQRRIAAILSSLDDKIENNNRINRNLEAQAQALFKSWFVDFEPWGGKMPEDWREGNLLDVADLFDHKRIPLSGMQRDRMEKIYPYYGATSIMDYVDNYLFDGIYLLMGEDGSVMTDEGFPFLQYVEGKFWCNNHAHIMQGKNGYTTEMLYCLLNRTNVSGIVTGAVQGKISQASMKKIPVVLPPAKVCADMSGKLAPYFDEIRSLRLESARLAALRDTLLPKLMKGEIEV